jgi:hypothetical protein
MGVGRDEAESSPPELCYSANRFLDALFLWGILKMSIQEVVDEYNRSV